MNLINRQFQEFLKQKSFPMKTLEEDEAYVYQGRLSVGDNKIVDFAVSLSKDDDKPIGQIVFNNITSIPQGVNREPWLAFLNRLNLEHGLYYYFVLDNDNRIFARHVTELNFEVESFFNILLKGSAIVQLVLNKLNDFGK